MKENRLILDFLNTDVNNDGTYELPQFGTIRPNGDFKTSFTVEQTKFNKDWNWLMEVVEKIEDLGYRVGINGISCTVSELLNDEPIISLVLGDRKQKISLVHSAVVDFINYYNAKK
jgi:hypothetical protein